MSTMNWTSSSRGAEYRPATLRVYVSPVVAAPQSEEPRPAEWLAEIPAEHWTPMQLSWSVNGQPTTLRLRRVLGVGVGKPDRDRAEDRSFTAGDRLRLVEVGSGGPRGTTEREWFRGYVAQERIVIQGQGAAETCQAVAYGPEILLRGKVVSGQWHAAPSVDEALIGQSFPQGQLVRANTFRSHLPVVFNERGRPNASPACLRGNDAAWRLDSQAEAATAQARTFEAPGRSIVTDSAAYLADWWCAAPAVQSLVEMVDDYQVISPESMAMLPPALAEQAIGEVNVEGLDLLEALRAVLLPVGYGFAIEPWARADGRHLLNVFELHGKTEGSRIRKPYMAPIDGEPLAITDPEAQRVEVQRIEFIRDNHNVANAVTVIGDQNRKQAVLTFHAGESELHPAWDTSAHDLADWATEDVVDPMQWPPEGGGQQTIQRFDEDFTYGAKGLPDFRHVFRSFAWNEDGAFSQVIDHMADLSGYSAAQQGCYVRRPRPLGATFLRDDADARARNVPPFVQLGIDGDGESWIQVPAVIWQDRAGFTIPVNPLWQWHPYTCEYARHAASNTTDQTLFEQYGKYSYLTLLHNALRGSGVALVLRLVGSVECDEAVTGHAPRRLSSSWPLPADKVIRAEHRYRRREVPGGSDPFGLSADRHDTRDDSDAATSHAETVRDVLEDEVGHGSIVLRHVTRCYAPGDVVPQTQGRVIDLTVRSGEGDRAPVVAGVTWDFDAGANKTELLLDTSLLKVMQ
jgi:hypothetical protein